MERSAAAGRRSTLAVAVVAALAVAATSAAAAPCPVDAAAQAEALRAHLDRERRAAAQWRLGWGLGFGVAAVAQGGLVLAETNPLGDFDAAAEASLTMGAVKSAVGMAARIVSPVKVPRPTVTGDACADLAAAEAALRRAARSERQSFWLNHVGGLALQVGATLYIGLAADDAWDDAAISFGLGWAVGLASTYTQPRGAWHRHRATPAPTTVVWRLTPLVAPHAHGLGVVGAF